MMEKGGVEITPTSETQSGKTGFSKLNYMGTDPQKALEDTDLIFITVPSQYHEIFLNTLAPHLREGQSIIFSTGYWASLKFASKWKNMGLFDKVTLAEENIMPYLSKRTGPTTVHIYRYKRKLKIASFPGNRTEKVFAQLVKIFPQFEKVPNIIWTNIGSGGNPPIHVPLLLPVIGVALERHKGCKLYGEATVQGGRLLLAHDKERVAVAEKYGCERETQMDTMTSMYGYKKSETGEQISETMRKSDHAEHYMARLERVFDEDLCSWVIITHFAEKVEVPMPVTRSIIEIMGMMFDKNYWELAPKSKDLGISEMNAQEILQYFNYGKV
jgi:opine dehydrogenase